MRTSTIIVLLLSSLVLAAANGSIGRQGLRAKGASDTKAYEQHVKDAMSVVLGCGGHVEPEELKSIEEVLMPMWLTLPKNSHGRIDRRFFRYLAHRYFMQTSSISVRGFEPTRLLNSSSWGSAEILSQRVPAFVESVLQSRHADEHGFSLEDAKTMIVALKQLIFDSQSGMLAKAYRENGFSEEAAVGREDMKKVMEVYLVMWLMADDPDGLDMLLKDRTQLESSFPHWRSLVSFAEGQIKAMAFARNQEPKPKHVASIMKQQYSFDDAHEIVGSITDSFGSFWESECVTMKQSLADMDPKHTGRVPLSKFYGSAMDTEWRFSESEQYLRELGALDETSRWGKQVIIPNYLQGANNCIVSGEHYLVCCANECEGLMGEVESKVSGPLAYPEEILGIVGNMTSHSISLDDEDAPKLEGALTKQLDDIASAHGGKVPIHGRLFAQWLHYAFPRECPFPHKTGATVAATPMEYGVQFVASKDTMQKHVEAAESSNLESELLDTTTEEEMQWMSQWSDEEELVGDYAGQIKTGGYGRMLFGFALLIAMALAGLKNGFISEGKSGYREPTLPMTMKTHYV
eukprot:gnl/TRDRNA2_/TRDRNA2_180141_c0_seq1.p1 gnl/TRDRNA2_/TRDRNA2_180141_c0~~gnl/TRDRNA2_/TRDRNA2_180141_c0_seq1.p1  ORF type:complete len:575 (+),score=125.08 gnl/TRDRNA2_/TRDRNA2_180141_c0_seq1:131-1855(+)